MKTATLLISILLATSPLVCGALTRSKGQSTAATGGVAIPELGLVYNRGVLVDLSSGHMSNHRTVQDQTLRNLPFIWNSLPRFPRRKNTIRPRKIKNALVRDRVIQEPVKSAPQNTEVSTSNSPALEPLNAALEKLIGDVITNINTANNDPTQTGNNHNTHYTNAMKETNNPNSPLLDPTYKQVSMYLNPNNTLGGNLLTLSNNAKQFLSSPLTNSMSANRDPNSILSRDSFANSRGPNGNVLNINADPMSLFPDINKLNPNVQSLGATTSNRDVQYITENILQNGRGALNFQNRQNPSSANNVVRKRVQSQAHSPVANKSPLARNTNKINAKANNFRTTGYVRNERVLNVGVQQDKQPNLFSETYNNIFHRNLPNQPRPQEHTQQQLTTGYPQPAYYTGGNFQGNMFYNPSAISNADNIFGQYGGQHVQPNARPIGSGNNIPIMRPDAHAGRNGYFMYGSYQNNAPPAQFPTITHPQQLQNIGVGPQNVPSWTYYPFYYNRQWNGIPRSWGVFTLAPSRDQSLKASSTSSSTTTTTTPATTTATASNNAAYDWPWYDWNWIDPYPHQADPQAHPSQSPNTNKAAASPEISPSNSPTSSADTHFIFPILRPTVVDLLKAGVAPSKITPTDHSLSATFLRLSSTTNPPAVNVVTTLTTVTTTNSTPASSTISAKMKADRMRKMLTPPYMKADYDEICVHVNQTFRNRTSVTFGPINKDCAQYVQCHIFNGFFYANESTCAFGLWYDRGLGFCVDSDAITRHCIYNPCTTLHGANTVNVAYPGRCDAYYSCEGGSATAEMCDAQINFNPTLGTCCTAGQFCPCGGVDFNLQNFFQQNFAQFMLRGPAKERTILDVIRPSRKFARAGTCPNQPCSHGSFWDPVHCLCVKR